MQLTIHALEASGGSPVAPRDHRAGSQDDHRFRIGALEVALSLYVEGASSYHRCADQAVCIEAPGLLCAAVFDGAGTPPADAVAADAAVAALRKQLNHRADRDLPGLLKRLDEAVAAAGRGTVSASILVLRETAAAAITAGDTQIWSLHAPIAEGLMTHRSTSRLGGYDGRAMPTAAAFGQQPIVLGSDGLFGFLDPSEIRALTARHPAGTARELCALIKDRNFSLPDDFAAIVIRRI
jgi:serine/threonine protein phosphatase PrpC